MPPPPKVPAKLECGCCGAREPAKRYFTTGRLNPDPTWVRHLDRGELACGNYCAWQLQQYYNAGVEPSPELMLRWEPWPPRPEMDEA